MIRRTMARTMAHGSMTPAATDGRWHTDPQVIRTTDPPDDARTDPHGRCSNGSTSNNGSTDARTDRTPENDTNE